jgi:primosomal replication protein N
MRYESESIALKPGSEVSEKPAEAQVSCSTSRCLSGRRREAMKASCTRGSDFNVLSSLLHEVDEP